MNKVFTHHNIHVGFYCLILASLYCLILTILLRKSYILYERLRPQCLYLIVRFNLLSIYMRELGISITNSDCGIQFCVITLVIGILPSPCYIVKFGILHGLTYGFKTILLVIVRGREPFQRRNQVILTKIVFIY